MKLTLDITGTRPMLQHNGRLANPIDIWTRRLKELTGKRKKTDDDLIEIMRIEARASLYETTDGLVGLPAENVWRCLYDAAKAFKRGEDIKRGLMMDNVVEPLIIDGDTARCDDWVADPDHIDYRPVKIMGKKTMRARPIIRSWAATHHFEILDDVVDARDMAPIIERAGRLVGLGDWRPTYGTFSAEVS